MKLKTQIAQLLTVAILLLSNYSNANEKTKNQSAIKITDSTFSCIRDMTKVDGFYVGNLIGNIAATVKAAKSKTGVKYPAGSVIQLVPGEAMVKHHSGFSPATKDWEFFELNVTPKNTKIGKRGFANVVNRFGGNCFGCHIKAKPQWDMVCKTGHGCDPIPITKEVLALIQKTDPRCKNNEKLSAQEIKILMQLKKNRSSVIKEKLKITTLINIVLSRNFHSPN